MIASDAERLVREALAGDWQGGDVTVVPIQALRGLLEETAALRAALEEMLDSRRWTRHTTVQVEDITLDAPDEDYALRTATPAGEKGGDAGFPISFDPGEVKIVDCVITHNAPRGGCITEEEAKKVLVVERCGSCGCSVRYCSDCEDAKSAWCNCNTSNLECESCGAAGEDR